MKAMIILALCVITLFICCGSKRYTGSPECVKSWKATDDFGRRLSKKYHMDFLGSGLNRMVDSKSDGWCISLADYQCKLTINEARPLAATLTRNFLDKLYRDPAYANYLNYTVKEYPKTNTTLRPELIGMKIAFWDENVDRPLYPYVAQIRIVEGKIHYYYADPKTHALQEPPITETIEEAMKHIPEGSASLE